MQVRGGRAAARGMTLIEVMVVLVIMGLIAGAVGISVLHAKDQADLDCARTDLTALREGLELWRMRHPTLPDSLAELAPDHVRRVRPDPWGTPYAYTHDGDRVDLRSYGPDRVASADDVREDADAK
jgi:general secretion pathway protein G